MTRTERPCARVEHRERRRVVSGVAALELGSRSSIPIPAGAALRAPTPGGMQVVRVAQVEEAGEVGESGKRLVEERSSLGKNWV